MSFQNNVERANKDNSEEISMLNHKFDKIESDAIVTKQENTLLTKRLVEKEGSVE